MNNHNLKLVCGIAMYCNDDDKMETLNVIMNRITRRIFSKQKRLYLNFEHFLK